MQNTEKSARKQPSSAIKSQVYVVPRIVSLSPTHPAPFHFVMLPTLDGEWVDREAGRMGLGKVRQEKQEGGEGEKKRLQLVPAQRVRGAD